MLDLRFKVERARETSNLDQNVLHLKHDLVFTNCIQDKFIQIHRRSSTTSRN